MEQLSSLRKDIIMQCCYVLLFAIKMYDMLLQNLLLIYSLNKSQIYSQYVTKKNSKFKCVKKGKKRQRC